jgi:hypothetical protein
MVSTRRPFSFILIFGNMKKSLSAKSGVLYFGYHLVNRGRVSESGDCATLFFRFGNTGVDAAIAIFLPTLRRFSCNGAMD